MMFTSLILFAVSDRGLYANLPLYITTAHCGVKRTDISTVQVKRLRSRKVPTHADAKTAVNSDSLNSIP